MQGSKPPSFDGGLRWPAPVLDRAGQQEFWDRQVGEYGFAQMTTDNTGELAIVGSLCRDFVKEGFFARDIISLGGAIGCRDPLVVTDELQKYGLFPQRVFFNDLSAKMTDVAVGNTLSVYREAGCEVTALPGPIHEVAKVIPPLPRRVIIGVYHAEALVEARPLEGYPDAGIEEYLKNTKILGEYFLIEPVWFEGTRYMSLDMRACLPADSSLAHKKKIENLLKWFVENQTVDAIRIIGCHRSVFGFFLSHWFKEESIDRLIRSCFDERRLKSITITRCAKGLVFCIDPIQAPQGIVTVLNNVIGNVLPHEQAETLRAIDRLSS